MSDSYLDKRRRVAGIVRAFSRELVTADLAEADLEAAITQLGELRKRFALAPRLQRNVDGNLVSKLRGVLDLEHSWDCDSLVGRSNPIAPPMRQTDESRCNWVVTFGHVYEGHPGLVHGGFVAAALDHVLGCVASTTEGTSMTGTLTTRYRKPTPAHVELVCRGRLNRREGRKVFCSAELLEGESLLAEAEGIFFRFDARVPNDSNELSNGASS